MEKPAEDNFLQINPKWPLENDAPLIYANQFALFETEHEVILVFGNFMPIISYPNRSREEIEEYLSRAEIKPLAKIVLSHGGFKALLGMLKGKMDEKGEAPHGNDD